MTGKRTPKRRDTGSLLDGEPPAKRIVHVDTVIHERILRRQVNSSPSGSWTDALAASCRTVSEVRIRPPILITTAVGEQQHDRPT